MNYTDLPFIVKEEFAFTDGIYSGYDADKRSYDKTSWDYEIGADGYAKVDPTLTHPRCVYNLLKQHYARYVPDMVERVCGTPKDKVLHIWEMIASTATPTRAMTIMYALGWTQHSIGSQMIRTGAMVQAAARQYRSVRRRHECAARALEHPGADRSGFAVESAAGLHFSAQRKPNRTTASSWRPAR